MTRAQSSNTSPCPVLATFFCRKGGKARFSTRLLGAAIIALPLLLSACRSNHVEITIQNQTGADLRLLEVDYPSASFGAASLAPGAALHYRIQVQGSGPVSVTYTAAANSQPHITGPELANHQQGSLEIVLLPEGKAEFHPQLTAGR